MSRTSYRYLELRDWIRRYPYSIALAALPVVVFALSPGLTSRSATAPAAMPVKVKVEGIRRVDMDVRTFNARWLPVHQMAPAMARVPEAPPLPRLRPQAVMEAAEPERVTNPPSPARRVRQAVLRPDICQRHNMRKVHYGRTWRCRK